MCHLLGSAFLSVGGCGDGLLAWGSPALPSPPAAHIHPRPGSLIPIDSAVCLSTHSSASAPTAAHQHPHPPFLPLPLQVAGQYILKQGDEVAFVLHTNLKSGELNAQRVRRTKEAPEPPPAPGELGWMAGGQEGEQAGMVRCFPAVARLCAVAAAITWPGSFSCRPPSSNGTSAHPGFAAAALPACCRAGAAPRPRARRQPQQEQVQRKPGERDVQAAQDCKGARCGAWGQLGGRMLARLTGSPPTWGGWRGTLKR